MWTRAALAEHLTALGLGSGDAVLVHAGLRSVGPMLGGPDALINALCDAVGPEGTILGYCDWNYDDRDLADPALRAQVPPFDPARSRATRDNGAFPELLRTTPGAFRSANPGASMAALGRRAEWFTADHALDYGYGPQSPLGKLVAAGGKTLLVGAPLDTMTLLHHAEHLADIPGKRLRRYQSPLLVAGQTVWRDFEEFDTSDPVVDGLADDYFEEVVEDFLATGQGRRGLIGHAPSVLVAAPAIVAFAVDWLERRFGP
ncbi:aminoglycoside 3-N-acetyltransferase [Devosia sp. Root635]|nr:aminoglycoside 3-N-acetyltransferase [Devosia sp. Root635]KRA44973.1 aminoglycoside 3-N-acetyltransferase [Devosia sp. Root635]